jgi:hypothetical protein
MPSRGRTEQTRRCCEQGTVKEVLRAGDRRAGPSRSCRGGAESKESSRSRQAGSEVLRGGLTGVVPSRGGRARVVPSRVGVVLGWCRAGVVVPSRAGVTPGVLNRGRSRELTQILRVAHEH